ncbi:MAG: dephospho-CoA kinase [Bacteroidaceae bacterium]|nr:dephospho-CoA kinase [Bacteroidaceae bacterium]MBO7167589.1 dephospho-CoA kinase [Bacteroidaceae bacterium]
MEGLCILGITGGIGCGKSFVSSILKECYSIPVYDCDREAKRLMSSDEGIRGKLIGLVGEEVYSGEVLNRKFLADFLFSNADNAQCVNAIVHPAVWSDFLRWAKDQRCPLVALESAILFECGFNARMDYVLFVDAPEDMRLHRAMQRDSASEEQIRARMSMQHPVEYRQLSDFIVDNSRSDDKSLLEVLNRILNEIKRNAVIN